MVNVELAKMLGLRFGTKNMQDCQNLASAFNALKVDIKTFDAIIDVVGIKNIGNKTAQEIMSVYKQS